MELLTPEALVLLALVPILVGVYVWRLRRRRPTSIRFSSLALVRDAMPRGSRVRRHLPFALLCAAIASLVVAVARPAALVSVPTTRVTIVLAMDVSGSMCSTDIPPTRLETAQQAASSFVQRQPNGTQIGVVAFSGFAELVQAPTTDQELLLDAIASLATGRRTAVGSGILASIDAISEVDPEVPRSLKDGDAGPPPPPVAPGVYAPDIIVVLTDGVSNAGPEPVEAAQQAKDRGIRVYTIGFGTAAGGEFDRRCRPQFIGREPGSGFGGPPPGFGGGGFRRGIDEATLKEVADSTGGEYYTAESAGELQKVFEQLPTYLVFKTEALEVSVAFVALAAVLLTAGILLGQLWRPLPT